MAKNMYFYNIGIINNEGLITNKSILDFLCKIENFLEDERIVRTLGGETFRVFSYYRRELDNHMVVIPIGTYRKKDVPWSQDDEDPKKLVRLNARLFDINSLVYDETFRVLMCSSNKNAPSIEDIARYLNTFFIPTDGYKLVVSPIIYKTGIEKLYNTEQVKMITFKIDLSDNVNNYFLDRIENDNQPLIAMLSGLMHTSKDVANTKKMTFTMSVGEQKNSSLDKESILQLLECMNLDSQYISEVDFKYKDGNTQTIEPAKIKKASVILRGNFSVTDLSPEYLKDNVRELFLNKRRMYIEQVDRFFANCVQDEDTDYEINKVWEEDEMA